MPMQNPTFAFSFFFSCSRKTGTHEEHWAASWSIKDLDLFQGLSRSSSDTSSSSLPECWRQCSCTGCERFGYGFFSCKGNCEEMMGKRKIMTNLWNLWKEGSETLLHVHFEARISWLLQKRLPLLGQLYTLLTMENQKKIKWTTSEKHL